MKKGERASIKRHAGTSAPRPLDGRTLSIQVLTFFGRDPEKAQEFFNSAGLAAQDLRSVVDEPGFLPVALDYLMSDDRLLERFADESGLRPADIAATAQAAREREAWSGGDV